MGARSSRERPGAFRGKRDYIWLRGLRNFHWRMNDHWPWALEVSGIPAAGGEDGPETCAEGRVCDGHSEGCKEPDLKRRVCAGWVELQRQGGLWKTEKSALPSGNESYWKFRAGKCPIYSLPPLTPGDMFPNPQRMSDTVQCSEPHRHYAFSYTIYTYEKV